jgi:GNAT superfamily N-acetyltransferase
MPHTSRKRALQAQARENGRSYQSVLTESGEHNSVRIHKAKPSDLPRFFPGTTQPDMSRLALLQELLRRQTAGLGQLFVATTANACLGHLFLVLRHERAPMPLDRPLLTYYWVRENRRMAGIGRRLVTRAERWLEQNDKHRAIALVDPSDWGAIRLYESLGYQYFYQTESYRDEFQPDGRCIRRSMTLAIYGKDSPPFLIN